MLPGISASLGIDQSIKQTVTQNQQGASVVIGANFQPFPTAQINNAVRVAPEPAQIMDPKTWAWGIGLVGAVLLFLGLAKHIFKG